jgi:queuine tRNA-ribosyltransferase
MPLDIDCDCFVCKNYSREQLRHLYRTEKNLAARLSAIHNLYFYHDMMKGVREAIRQGTFVAYKKAFLSSNEIINK